MFLQAKAELADNLARRVLWHTVEDESAVLLSSSTNL